MVVAQVVAADRCGRVFKGQGNIAMSPVLTLLSEASHGRTLLQSMELRDKVWESFAAATDQVTRWNFLSNSVISWQTLWSYISSFLFSLVGATWVLYGPLETPQAQVGLALTYAFLLPYYFLFFAFVFAVLNISMTSLERVLECLHLPEEPEWHLQTDSDKVWPSAGAVEFNDAVLVYRPGLPPALRGVTLTIPGGSRCGVVGRTGAGKSSLVGLLFRLVDVESGSVAIDGVDVRQVGLQRLRQAMGIIPQEPLLFNSNVRDNLDPFSERKDAEVQDVLRQIGLGGMGTGADLSATGLSAGERQLVSVARAMLRHAPVVVMDEPTSNVDHDTDQAVQLAVRTCFTQSTVITIAHRLDTIVDSDMIVVMDAGQVAEIGRPHELVEMQAGLFSGMVSKLGDQAAQELRRRARMTAS